MTTPDFNVRTGPVIAVLAAAGIIASLTQTLVVPLLGSLPEIFRAAPATTSWVVTVTLLAGAVCMPVLGRLADMYGKRRIILVALMPLVIGSIICAVSTSVYTMIVGRALQGIATAMVPLGISLLHDILPPHKVGGALALMSSSMGIGGAIGLPVAAAVAQYASWRALFWVTAGLAAAVAVAIRAVVADPARPSAAGRFDIVGAIGLAIALIALLLGISRGGTWGWTSPVTLAMFALAAVTFAAWGAWELHTPIALVDLRVAARPTVLVTNIASVFIGFAMYAQSLLIPQLMQLPTATGYGLGQSMLQMGLWMAPTGLAMMAISPVGARLTRTYGPRTTLVIGGIVMAAGYAGAAMLTGSLPGLMCMAALGSTGLGLAFGSMPSLIMNAVPPANKAAANAFNALMRSIGTSMSAAVIAALLAAMSIPGGDHAVIPTLAGFRTGLLVGCGVAIVAAVVAALIPVRPGRPEAATVTPRPA